jgi:DNA invertase Pin-like site-specific DNA recombinase
MIYVFLKNRSTSESFEAKKNKIEELLKKGDITPLYITDSTKKSKKFRDLLVSCCEGDIIYVNNLSEISYNISIVFKCIKNAILKKVSIISINGTINEKTFEDINLLGFLEVASEICASVD